ncbi:MAG: Na/Pi cotransporter family protein [Alphaproteobacteria bacterium]|nr:Na/Pi cotransporter family protein [Alphaproteobacteria bacterium]MBV9375344.1 Na/Pi cotransporter family protein [Alphaproteobacteria bacterium]
MGATLTLFDLAGAVALLIWGVHMVQIGITRAFGPQLRRLLGYALGSRFKAFLAGLGVTSILQSSTATGLMVAAFAAGGLVDLVPALAVMLGANVGTTLIVQVLSFDVSRVSLLFVLIGVFMFRRSAVTRTRDLGRVGIGLGLMLIALQHLLALITPYEDVPSLRMLLGAVTTDPLIDVLIAAALTWAAHSSVAVVLLIMAFAAQGVVPPHAAFALVLGANLGTAINPLLESGVSGDPAAKRLPIGNLINRVAGCALALCLLKWAGPALISLDPDPGRAVADFHTAFNFVLALLFFPLLKPYAKLLVRFLPTRVDTADPSQPIYLDWAARETPTIALAGAAREALRMADVLEGMLRGALDSLNQGDRKRVAETARMDDVLDRLDTAIKEYLTSLDIDTLDDTDHRRLSEILAFTTNLEHAGDIVEKSLMPLAAKRIKRGVSFSETGRREIREMLERLTGNARAAAAVFMTDDPATARQLLGEKEVFRELETRATEGYFGRARTDRAESIEASTLFLDIVRDLKRVNAHLAAAAYPVLEGRGELLPSRLKQEV